jgi:hypothetical protein
MAQNIGTPHGLFVSKDNRIRTGPGGEVVGKMSFSGGYWYAKIGDGPERIGWKKAHALSNAVKAYSEALDDLSRTILEA